MRFQKRLLLNYVGLLLAAVVSVCALSFQALWQRYKTEEYSYLRTMSRQMAQYMELEYSSMVEVTESILSDSTAILDNLKTLARTSGNSSYRVNAEKNIETRMDAYHIVKNYYRVLIYNEQGDIFASYNYDDRTVHTRIPDSQRVWMERARGRKGQPILMPVHGDPWGKKEGPSVYGILREILGYDCYLEVQQKEESLTRIFTIYDPNIRVVAVFGENEILYGDAEDPGMDFYKELGARREDAVTEVGNPLTKKAEIVSSAYSELTGITVLVIEDRGIILEKMSGLLWNAFLVVVLAVGLLILFLNRLSRNMARPINELRRQMAQTSLDNMEDRIHMEDSMDEIRALAQTYEELLRRLKESLMNEKNLTNLQLQARYDLLQAQINPHFFHNVLNVISAKGLMLGDESICEICGSLSDMLRYATGNKTRYAQIGEELKYLGEYLYLMKLRYQHKLEYLVETEEELGRQYVPKIVFQQIVENSIRHGFNDCVDVMKIEVRGYLTCAGRKWVMEFRDNGTGIEEETVEKLQREMEHMRRQLTLHHEQIEMEIGGMGLLNTYARLFLFFGDAVVFAIDGSAEGTVLKIEAPCTSKDVPEKEENGAADIGGRRRERT